MIDDDELHARVCISAWRVVGCTAGILDWAARILAAAAAALDHDQPVESAVWAEADP